MTKIVQNTHKSKTLFLNEIEQLDSYEAKALLPFFKKYSPLSLFKAFENITSLSNTKGKNWNVLLFLQRQALDVYSYENRLGLHNQTVGLNNFLASLFFDANAGYVQRALEWYLKQICTGDEECKMNKKTANIVFSYLNACHYYCEIQPSEETSSEPYFKTFI